MAAENFGHVLVIPLRVAALAHATCLIMGECGIDPVRLNAFATAAFAALNVPHSDAALIADSLVQADLWGHQSHGVMRLPWYTKRLQTSAMNAVTQPETVVDAGAIAVIDGHDGVGQVLAASATAEAMWRAKQHGVGAVAVRNSNHFGNTMYHGVMGRAKTAVGRNNILGIFNTLVRAGVSKHQ